MLACKTFRRPFKIVGLWHALTLKNPRKLKSLWSNHQVSSSVSNRNPLRLLGELCHSQGQRCWEGRIAQYLGASLTNKGDVGDPKAIPAAHLGSLDWCYLEQTLALRCVKNETARHSIWKGNSLVDSICFVLHATSDWCVDVVWCILRCNKCPWMRETNLRPSCPFTLRMLLGSTADADQKGSLQNPLLQKGTETLDTNPASRNNTKHCEASDSGRWYVVYCTVCSIEQHQKS